MTTNLTNGSIKNRIGSLNTLGFNRAGSYLPDRFFRRVDEEIESAWNNETYSSEGITFTNPTGVKYVPIDIFRSTIRDFIDDFLDKLMLRTKNKRDTERFFIKVKDLKVEYLIKFFLKSR